MVTKSIELQKVIQSLGNLQFKGICTITSYTVDDFGELWIELFGREGQTNYFHMLQSGHFAYFMTKWSNLYRYEQQNWEAFNAQLKYFYFNRTQRGGHCQKGGGTASKLDPVARWVQRLIMWRTGKADEELINSKID